MIPYGKQQISQQDIDAVTSVLKSDFLTQGPIVPAFEQAVADYCGANYGIASNSATSALHLACMALELSEGDWLWTSPITFVASANCGRYCGASIDFVDIDPATFNLCPKQLEQKLICAKQAGKLPKALVAVHMGGLSCDMAAIAKLAQQYDFKVIEDASHAIGGSYQNHKVGSCQYSDISIFSFHPVKIITSGEGGMAVTNDKTLAERMAQLRSHGVTRNPELIQAHDEGPWYYEQLALGYNYRITDLQAALGLSQLERLDQFIEQRHQLVKQYQSAFTNLPLQLQQVPSDCVSAYHLFLINLTPNAQVTRRELYDHLKAKGINVNVHYIPVHTQPYYQSLGFKAGDFPNAENYYQLALTLPLYPDLQPEQQQHVINSVKELLCS